MSSSLAPAGPNGSQVPIAIKCRGSTLPSDTPSNRTALSTHQHHPAPSAALNLFLVGTDPEHFLLACWFAPSKRLLSNHEHRQEFPVRTLIALLLHQVKANFTFSMPHHRPSEHDLNGRYPILSQPGENELWPGGQVLQLPRLCTIFL